MSTQTASVTDVSRNFSDYLNRVAYGGDRFMLVRGGKTIAELKGCSGGKKMSDLLNILIALPSLSEQETADFKEDVNTLRKSVSMEKSIWDA